MVKARRPTAWASRQRNEDYYNEGLLIWLEADQIIRAESNGTKSLDDFARVFFGGRDGDWGVRTYDLSEVVATLNAVWPYDWEGFLNTRVYAPTNTAPLNGLTMGGYKLVYTATKSPSIASNEKRAKSRNYTYGPGLSINDKGEVKDVVWDSPAFTAGLTIGHKIVTVNGAAFTYETWEAALVQAKEDQKPIILNAEKDKAALEYSIDYSGGLVYPALEK